MNKGSAQASRNASSSSRHAGINASGTKRPPKSPKWPRSSGSPITSLFDTSSLRVRPGVAGVGDEVDDKSRVLDPGARFDATGAVHSPGVTRHHHIGDVQRGETSRGDNWNIERTRCQSIPGVSDPRSRTGAIDQNGVYDRFVKGLELLAFDVE